MTSTVAHNYAIYERRRDVKSTIDGDLSKYPRTILFCLDKIVLDISKKLALKVGISFEDLLPIGLNFNVCGNSGLAPHIDLCRNGDFGDFIVNLIITGGGFVVFSESKAKTTACCGFWLGPGDIYLISKSARFNFFHKVITAGAKSRRIARTISGVQKVEFDPKGIRLTLTLRYFYNRDKLQDELFDKDLS